MARMDARVIIIGLALAFGAAGCAQVQDVVQSTVDGVKTAFEPAKQSAPAVQESPRYCYRTLGKVNCYTQPLPAGEANRLVGYEGPAPRATSGTGPLNQ